MTSLAHQHGGTEVKTFPTLYKRNSNGSLQQWTIFVGTDTFGYGWLITDYGQVDGSLQRAEDCITEGKNVGKANETTPLEQAFAEAQAKWEGKLKKGYVQSLDDAQEGKTDAIIAGGVNPMLAHPFEKFPHKVAYPAFIQPKLDGHRCIAVIQNGECKLWSRTRKLITGVPHIARMLEARFPGETLVLDGELYNHDYREKFEELSSFIRSQTPKPGHEIVQYWVYDIINDKPQESRLRQLSMIGIVGEKIIPVPTEKVENQDELTGVFPAYLEHGYEGMMVRNAQARYKGSRSHDLLKVKVMQDAEFELVRIESGRGKMEGKAIFTVVTETGQEFRCKLVGALDSLTQYVDEPEKWIGKLVTVKYQNLSADGIPRFPIALRFREDV